MAKQIAQFDCITNPSEYDMDELMRIWKLIFGRPGKINDISMKESHCLLKKYESGSVQYMRLRKKNDILRYLKENWENKSMDLYIGRDTYINGANFFNSSTHFSCKNICIDIDNHNADPEKIRHEVNAFFLDLQTQRGTHNKIPMPNTVVYTGRGIQLWYHLESVSARLYSIVSKTADALCKKFQDYIAASPMAYADLEVDVAASARCCGLSRLPGSYNPKAKCYTQGIVLFTKKWDINELKNKAGVPDAPKKKKQKKSGKSERTNNRSRFAALLLRVLREAAKAGDYTSREVLCHVYHSTLLMRGIDQEQAEESVRDFNQLFDTPLPERQIDFLVRCNNCHGYHYSEKGMFSKSGISNERTEAYFQEKKYLYKPRDYKLENAERDKKRLAERIAWQNEIRDLRQQGLSATAISERTGHCRQTVKKYMDTPIVDAEQAIKRMIFAASEETQEKARPAKPEPAAATELDRKRRAVQLYKRGFRTAKIARIMEATKDEVEEYLAEYKLYRSNRNEINYAIYRIGRMSKYIISYLREGYEKLAKMKKAGIKGDRIKRIENFVNDLYNMNVRKQDLIRQLRNINPKSTEQMEILPVVLSEFSCQKNHFRIWVMNWKCQFLDEKL